MNSTKLNLGSGQYNKDGFINIDIDPLTSPDVVHNLNEFPYPFEDSTFEHIEADHVVEHLENPIAITKELHRIAKNGASIIIRVPHFSRGFTHPDHKRGFDVSFPLYFNSSFKGGYSGTELTLKSMKLKWFAQEYLKKETLPFFMYVLGKTGGIVFDFFANLSPYLCSRIWCFWVGGFEEVSFQFEVKK